MSEPTAIEKALQEWRLKNNIQKGDPLEIGLELVQIYLNNHERLPVATLQTNEAQPSYQEFRETVQLMDKQSKVLENTTKRLVEEFRLAEIRFKDLKPVTSAGLLLIATLAITVGILFTLWITTRC